MHLKRCGHGRLLRVLMVVSLAVAGYGCGRPKETVPFQSTVWQETVGVRHKMIDDLKENHLTVGMSRESIIRLLGEPHYELDATEVYRPMPGVKWFLYYTLDCRELGAFECAYFVVDLSEDKKYLGASVFAK